MRLPGLFTPIKCQFLKDIFRRWIRFQNAHFYPRLPCGSMIPQGRFCMMKNNLKDIGIYGRRHYDYLRKNKPTVINVMRMNGTLNNYLKSVNKQAEEMLFQLVKQLAKQEGVTEELKRRDQMAWVSAMNNIRDRANEIVLNEVIFV